MATYFLVNRWTDTVRSDFDDTRDWSAPRLAADFLYDCTCDEEVNIDDWILCKFEPYGQSRFDLDAKYDERATESMRKWFRKFEEEDNQASETEYATVLRD